MPTTTTFTSGGRSVPVEVFEPATPAKGAAIVIVHGSDGLVDNERGPWATMMRQYAADLAQKGFKTLIPNYFEATDTPPGSVDLSTMLRQRASWQQTIEDAVVCARGQTGVDPSRIGLFGFSLGGHLAARARATAKVLVAFFAPILDGVGAAPVAALQVQMHHGKGDLLVPFELNAPQIELALRAGGASSTIFPYAGAGHGFVGDDPANMKARTESRARTLTFFDSHL